MFLFFIFSVRSINHGVRLSSIFPFLIFPYVAFATEVSLLENHLSQSLKNNSNDNNNNSMNQMLNFFLLPVIQESSLALFNSLCYLWDVYLTYGNEKVRSSCIVSFVITWATNKFSWLSLLYKAMLIMLRMMNCSNTVVLCALERVCIQIHVGIHRKLEEYHGNWPKSYIFQRRMLYLCMCSQYRDFRETFL